MGASDVLLRVLLRPGDHLVIPHDAYGGTFRLVDKVLAPWGIEYTPSRTKDQRRKATAMVKAGADLILGAHSHVVGAMESIDRVPVLYSMGNFIFDLTRFEQTLEGVIVVATFQGDRLLQLDLKPTVLIDLTQPNLLDPERDGRVVLQRVRKASKGLYP